MAHLKPVISASDKVINFNGEVPSRELAACCLLYDTLRQEAMNVDPF